MQTPVDARLRDARWERIQLVLRFEGDPGPMQLVQAAGPHDSMPATRQWRDGDDTLVRFNPFQGPGLVPLAAGEWRLSGASGVPIRVTALPGAIPHEVATRDLALPVSVYRVRTGVSDDGVLTVGVEVDARSTEAERAAGPAQRMWRRRRRGVWRLAFRAMRRLSGRRPTILFATRLNSRLTGNLESVYSRMVERGLAESHRLMVVAKPDIGKPMSWRERVRLLAGMAAAKVIFLDDSFYPVYWVQFPEDVRIVQLWHAAGAFKTVGYSRSATAGKPPFNPWGKVHKNTTHVIVSSDFDAPFYAEALGVPERRLFPTGIPRMDRFFDPARRDAAIAKARQLLPQIAGHQVWLFAPTYRGDKVATASYDFERLDLDALYALAVEKDAVVLFKHHPFITHRIEVPAAQRDRLVEATDVPIDVNDLLFSVDLLITDYSSIVFEYSVLGRPMVFYAYDLAEYTAERDFYVPFEQFVPGPIVQTFGELLDVIRRGDLQVEKVDAFARTHFAHLDGRSTDRVIDLALGE